MDDISMATTLKECLAQLETLGNENVRARNSRNGTGDNQFGVQLGDVRKLAAKIKTNHGRLSAKGGWLMMILGLHAPER
jgi:hypothetical protein